MTNHFRDSDKSVSRFDNYAARGHFVRVVLTTPIPRDPRDPVGVEWVFLRWAWGAGYRNWREVIWTSARVLRGLQHAGLIDRTRVRTESGVLHGFVLTDAGQQALAALSGSWIKEVR